MGRTGVAGKWPNSVTQGGGCHRVRHDPSVHDDGCLAVALLPGRRV